MMNETAQNKIPFNFTYYAMKLLGKNLYSNPWTAISELVANGIDSQAKTVHVLVDMRDKEHAVVEIFDDGFGMSHEDLREKYTVIGRNKRESNENRIGKTLGRKGIGKLAALYLSPEYYLYTKNGLENSAWQVNTLEYKDSDFPTMNQIPYDSKRLIATDIWEKQASGTMIHLSSVDLRKIGSERLKRLPTSLADYYLDSIIDCAIMVCVLQNPDDEVVFSKIEKNIHFETMYAIFDNTDHGYRHKLLPNVYLTKPNTRPEVDIPRTTQVLDTDKYNCNGDIQLTTLTGDIQNVQYALTGWIGIHCSIDNDVLCRNTSNGKKLRPNALRLYVRGKLAVDNLMNYIKSSQALATYIEGEISFDILDDDRFEDASTSSREGYSLSDPRVMKLIEITKKIIRALIDERTTIGNTINNEIKALEKQEKEEQERKQKEAEERAQMEETARKKAEQAAEEAKDAQRQAEAETKAAKQEASQYKQQNRVIFSAISEDQENFAEKCHLVKTNALTIRNSVTTLARKIGIDNYRELGAIAISSERILSSLRYSALANFNMRDEFIREDLFLFCEQFIFNIMAKQYPNIEFVVERTSEYSTKFSPQNIALIFDNLISNSEKSYSTQVVVRMIQENDKNQILYSDNGTGFKSNQDMSQIFEFGWSGTGGTGIGLYNVKRAVERMHGTITSTKNEPEGALFTIKL